MVQTRPVRTYLFFRNGKCRGSVWQPPLTIIINNVVSSADMSTCSYAAGDDYYIPFSGAQGIEKKCIALVDMIHRQHSLMMIHWPEEE
jgi:hypothetical protein